MTDENATIRGVFARTCKELFGLPRDAFDECTVGTIAHIAFHSEYIDPPQRYQIELPEGRFAQVQDFVLKRRRTIVAYGMRPLVGGREITGFLDRPRKHSMEGAWFQNLTDKQWASAYNFINSSLRRAWVGYEPDPDHTAVRINPLIEPVRLDVADVLRRRAEGWAR